MPSAFKLGALAIALACISAVTASAQGYDTYAGASGFVTTVQIEQAQAQAKAASDFRHMSIADRWDASAPGSIAQRWADNGPGSIAARWDQNAAGSIARRWGK